MQSFIGSSFIIQFWMFPHSSQSDHPFLRLSDLSDRGCVQMSPLHFLIWIMDIEENLESWYWVTIAGMTYSENEQVMQVFICDEGITKLINLKLWLETTVQGGGFVYFLPDSRFQMEEPHGKFSGSAGDV